MVSMSIPGWRARAATAVRHRAPPASPRQREHGREQPGLVDAQGAHHLAVPVAAHQRAKRVRVSTTSGAQEPADRPRWQRSYRGTGGPGCPPRLPAPAARGPNQFLGPQATAQRRLMTSTRANVASSWNSSGARRCDAGQQLDQRAQRGANDQRRQQAGQNLSHRPAARRWNTLRTAPA